MRLISVIAIVLCSLSLTAQHKRNIKYSGFFDTYYFKAPLSIEVGTGVTLYSGDLCESLDCNTIKPSFALGLGTKLWPHVYIGGELNYWMYGATSAEGKSVSGVPVEFSATGITLQGTVRYFLIDDIIRRHADLRKKPKLIKPYFSLGLGAGSVSPKVTSTSTGQEVSTNGGFIFYIPVGIGASINFSHRSSLIFELLGNYAFSDQLDGVGAAELPQSENDDLLLHVNVMFSWTPKAPRLRRKKIIMHPPSSSGGGGNSVNTFEEQEEGPTSDEPMPSEEETELEEETEEEPAEDAEEEIEEEETEDSEEEEVEETEEEEYYEEEESSTDGW